jgi:hypothetical protein
MAADSSTSGGIVFESSQSTHSACREANVVIAAIRDQSASSRLQSPMIFKKGMDVRSVMPETKREPPKRMRPRAKRPSALTTTIIVTPATKALLPIQRPKDFTKTLSRSTMNR